MSLDKLIHSILDEAKDEADQIVTETEAEVKRLLEEAGAETEILARKAFDTGTGRGRREASQRTSQARLAARNRLLEAEQGQIDLVMDLLRERLDALDDDAYQSWMTSSIVDSLSSQDERIVIRASDRERLPDSWKTRVETELAERGIDVPLHIDWSEEVDSPGYVLRHPNYDVEMTFDELLRVIETDRRADVARLLFER